MNALRNGLAYFGAAAWGYGVAALMSFYGSALLSLALREVIKPQMAGWVLAQGIPPTTAEGIQFTFATFVAFMLSVLLIAPFVGLLSAAVSRPLGTWRLLVPAVVLMVQAITCVYVTGRVTPPPHPTEECRVAMMEVRTSFHLLAIATGLAVVPAVVGSWLGTKLWPKREQGRTLGMVVETWLGTKLRSKWK